MTLSRGHCSSAKSALKLGRGRGPGVGGGDVIRHLTERNPSACAVGRGPAEARLEAGRGRGLNRGRGSVCQKTRSRREGIGDGVDRTSPLFGNGKN